MQPFDFQPSPDDPSPRVVRMIQPHRIANAMREPELEAAIRERLDRTQHRVITPTLVDRIADALGSRDIFIFCMGAYCGALLTAVLAYAWSFYL